MVVGSLHERLRIERDWCGALQREAAELRTAPPTAERTGEALELAAALELIEPIATARSRCTS